MQNEEYFGALHNVCEILLLTLTQNAHEDIHLTTSYLLSAKNNALQLSFPFFKHCQKLKVSFSQSVFLLIHQTKSDNNKVNFFLKLQKYIPSEKELYFGN